MGATNYAIRINGPTATTSKSVASTAATTAQSLGGAVRVWMTCSTSAHIRFGASTVAATAGDIPMQANTDYVFDLTGTEYYSALGAGAGTLYWAIVA